MESPGIRLKKVRERLNLRYRDVEQSSHEIARRHRSDEYVIALSRLADIENKGTLPTLYRLYSLCAIYRLSPLEVMRWYGLPLDRLTEDSLLFPPPSTNLLPLDSAKLSVIEETLGNRRNSAESQRTRVLPRELGANGWLAQSLLGLPKTKSIRLGIVGEHDAAMSPVLPPGSVVLVDDSRKKIARSGWKSETDRPIYLLESRDGFMCRWCNVQDGDLIAMPHPSAIDPPQRFRFPSEIEVVGEVVGVAMQRPQVRQSRIRS